MQTADSLEKTLMPGKTEEEKRMTEDKMIGWHHWLNGHEFEQTPGDGKGQGGLMWCSPWCRKESDTTEWALIHSIRWCYPTNSSSHPLLLSSIFASIRVFSNESAHCIRWPKYWSFSFSISPSNEYSGLVSFRMDWFDLLAVQWTLKSLLQHHSWKPSILQCSAF